MTTPIQALQQAVTTAIGNGDFVDLTSGAFYDAVESAATSGKATITFTSPYTQYQLDQVATILGGKMPSSVLKEAALVLDEIGLKTVVFNLSTQSNAITSIEVELAFNTPQAWSIGADLGDSFSSVLDTLNFTVTFDGQGNKSLTGSGVGTVTIGTIPAITLNASFPDCAISATDAGPITLSEVMQTLGLQGLDLPGENLGITNFALTATPPKKLFSISGDITNAGNYITLLSESIRAFDQLHPVCADCGGDFRKCPGAKAGAPVAEQERHRFCWIFDRVAGDQRQACHRHHRQNGHVQSQLDI